MASSPITSCQINGETMETVTAFIFLGSKIIGAVDSALVLGKIKLLLNSDAIKIASLTKWT